MDREIKILIAEAGDDFATLDAYRDVSEQISRIVSEKFPNAIITLLSDYFKTISHLQDIRGHIAALASDIRAYDLTLAYIPEPHMLNAILVWSANKYGVPVVVISQYHEHILSSMASYVVSDLHNLERLLNRQDFMEQFLTSLKLESG